LAAQSFEKTPEYPLPDRDSPVMGLFTYTLVQAIRANPGASFAQYRDTVLRKYAEMRRTHPTPIVVGTALDRSIAGQARPVRQWALSRREGRLVLAAGQLDSIAVGAVLSVLANPTDPDGALRGFVRVTDARAFDSDVEPIEHRGVSPEGIAILPQPIARLAAPSVPLVVRVGLPTPASPEDAARSRVSAAVAALRAADVLRRSGDVRIEWVEAGASVPDVVLLVDESRVWFAGPDGTYVTEGGRRTPSVELSDDHAALSADVAAQLKRIARWTNVARLASAFPADPFANLSVRLTVRRALGGQTEAVRPGQTISMLDGDRIEMRVDNEESFPVDLTVIYVDSTSRATRIFPIGMHTARLSAIRGSVRDGMTLSAETTGTERLFFLASQAQPQMPIADFSFLAEDSAQTARTVGLSTRDASGSPSLAELLGLAGFSDLLAERGERAVRPDTSVAARSWIGALTILLDGQPAGLPAR
jgi:hypothetical protein